MVIILIVTCITSNVNVNVTDSKSRRQNKKRTRPILPQGVSHDQLKTVLGCDAETPAVNSNLDIGRFDGIRDLVFEECHTQGKGEREGGGGRVRERGRESEREGDGELERGLERGRVR